MSRAKFTQQQEELFGQVFPFGTHGECALLDVMGSDRAIADAARKSYGSTADNYSDEKVRDLVRFMKRHEHTSPFEMAEMKFGLKIPMHVCRQLIRHRTANVNEFSTRYAEVAEEFEIIAPHDWRLQSKDNKQGSDGYLDEGSGSFLSSQQIDLQDRAMEVYRRRLAHGVSREMARSDLPLSTYTSLTWKIDLHNLFHFLEKRLDPTAQREIRELAWIMFDLVENFFPDAHSAFVDYVLCAVKLTRLDTVILGALLYDMGVSAFELNDEAIEQAVALGFTKREIVEHVAKMNRILAARHNTVDYPGKL